MWHFHRILIAATFLFLCTCSAQFLTGNSNDNPNSVEHTYIVYMGGKRGVEAEMLTATHHDILTKALGSKEKALESLKYSYKHAFSGFSARMTLEQANIIAEMPGVVNVFRNKMLNLHTTRSWDFLGLLETKQSQLAEPNNSSDVIVGLIDTGIWPESQSFNDAGMGPVPARWKGTCDNGKVTNASERVECNRKIIGARFYDAGINEVRYRTPRDEVGHGTHTSSTAAGRAVPGASMNGLASGTARGGLTSARIAVYKVCWEFRTCSEDGILAAFDDAIHDGIDVLSMSIGAGPLGYDVDSIAIGAFHAIERGISVSCSGGNSGPLAGTIANGAPWIFTVAASTMDRMITTSTGSSTTSEEPRVDFSKLGVAWGNLNGSPRENGTFNFSKLDLQAAKTIIPYTPAPVIATFSSRGPNRISPDVLKPDVAAPGVDVLAAWPDSVPNSNDAYVKYNLLSGTSMACPHVTGAIAYVKSIHPDWSPAAIKSAIMTTANTMDNSKHIITTELGSPGTPFDYGAGEIQPTLAADPGLIYDATPTDYEIYLCNSGYTTSKLRAITGDSNSACPATRGAQAPALNYPSFSFPELKASQTVMRTVTNVGPANSVYTVTVKAGPAVSITVNPTKLTFTSAGQKLTYTVTVKAKASPPDWSFSWLTWSDGKHFVRSPIAVNAK